MKTETLGAVEYGGSWRNCTVTFLDESKWAVHAVPVLAGTHPF